MRCSLMTANYWCLLEIQNHYLYLISILPSTLIALRLGRDFHRLSVVLQTPKDDEEKRFHRPVISPTSCSTNFHPDNDCADEILIVSLFVEGVWLITEWVWFLAYCVWLFAKFVLLWVEYIWMLVECDWLIVESLSLLDVCVLLLFELSSLRFQICWLCCLYFDRRRFWSISMNGLYMDIKFWIESNIHGGRQERLRFIRKSVVHSFIVKFIFKLREYGMHRQV